LSKNMQAQRKEESPGLIDEGQVEQSGWMNFKLSKIVANYSRRMKPISLSWISCHSYIFLF
jgi:hypothetical protein